MFSNSLGDFVFLSRRHFNVALRASKLPPFNGCNVRWAAIPSTACLIQRYDVHVEVGYLLTANNSVILVQKHPVGAITSLNGNGDSAY